MSASRSTVLVVEDESSLRTTMCAALTLMGFVTHQADSVDAALKIHAGARADTGHHFYRRAAVAC